MPDTGKRVWTYYLWQTIFGEKLFKPTANSAATIKEKKNRIRGMRMQMEYQFIIAYFCERPHSKIKIRPSRLQTLFNLLKILLSVTRITITTGHAYFFSHYCPPQPWEFLVVTQFLCRWTRSTAATLDLYPGIQGSGDSGIRGCHIRTYTLYGDLTIRSPLLLMPFHMVLMNDT